MISNTILIVAVTTCIAALIGGVSTYFGATRLLKVLFVLWAVLSILLMALALLGVPFDREVFVALWTYFALPALAGGIAGTWLVRAMKGRGQA